MSLFIDGTSPTRLSVNLLTPEPGQEPPSERPGFASDAELAIIGDRRVADLKRKNKLSPNQEFRGWAVLSVEDAEQDGRTVHHVPLPDNQQHMEIALPADAKESLSIRRAHASKLAQMTHWRPRPKV